MLITHKFTADLQYRGATPTIYAVQCDANTRAVELHLLNGCVPWGVPEGVTAAVGYKKPDRTAGIYETLPDGTEALTISGNTVTAILAPQMLTASGTVEAVVILTDAELNQLSTFSFRVCVTANPAAGVVTSENYINATRSAIENALTAAKESGEFDGFSPVVSIEETESGNRVLITDANGQHSFDVRDGHEYASSTVVGERVGNLDNTGFGGVKLTISTRTPQEDGSESVSVQDVSVYDGCSISGVIVETLEPGSEATAELTFPMPNKMNMKLGIPRGDSGVTTPVSSFFTLSVDEDGNLWAHSSENESVPEFEYDEETGALYFVTEQEE